MLKALSLVAALALTVGAAEAQSLKIGFMATLSGPAAQLGIDGTDGFKLALQKLGGKLGNVGAELVVVDDQLKPEIGVQLAKRLIERDNVDLIVGTTFSNVLMAIVQPITRANVFLLSPNAAPSPLAGAQCNPFFFSASYQNDQIYEPIGEYLRKKGVKRAVALAPNYQAGKDAIAGFKHTFQGEILDEIYTPLAQLDFVAELTRISSLKPDAIFAFYPGGLAVSFVKQYDQSALKGNVGLYGGFPLSDETVRAAQGPAALGVLTSGNWQMDLPNAANQQFVADFQKAYGRNPSEYAAFAYDTAMLLDSAIRAVSGNVKDAGALRTALRAAKFDSVRGTFSFNTNHFPIQDWYVRNVVAAEGGTKIVTQEKVFSAATDRFAKECTMKP